MNFRNKIKELAKEGFEDVLAIRRHLHKNPELSFQEFKTSAYIKSKLEEMGIPYTDGYVETGIVGRIEGKDPKSKVIALRADIDALPIHHSMSIFSWKQHPFFLLCWNSFLNWLSLGVPH